MLRTVSTVSPPAHVDTKYIGVCYNRNQSVTYVQSVQEHCKQLRTLYNERSVRQEIIP
jgi:hypothetical protein